ncbi:MULTISPECIES: beta-N-acetylhexosaminidase [unclassified Mesorhizobium]|uniref:beta-N-acetylhexosaminidase n=1 Tax=unclassified Mesorhizobium TaxID=325217 RepID=UPI0011285CAD|nr:MULTISPECIES: beta-N-acetylhexosaminidase [unclassified Mesorhizobium]MBZ9681413.1 beta-N-acetylhexosaminidase [Mesorhizobium sp. CO1-1-2]MBZ9693528.1 beta-N-acetylhexosaminidase [Mesorhizobium sp. CO1-1-9]MBZ9927709.1 beta-N-acetylhexosaminidase [Mesorhizobium sp. BR1-1-4]TPJ12875.1 beta-N-acetylhexosaminidase [Mesorhizobium sp. B2-7-3]TPK17378.1 beta-N-acetylhexosaminidase [Mesorhizobium sp. B2-5-7]
MTESKSMILGCAGKTLTREEIRFYRNECPWAFILFARNIGEAEQIRDLVAEMRDCIGRPDALVFIDQEGGRVQRLRPPLAPNYPAGGALGALWRDDHDAGVRAAWLMARLHAFDLLRYGISADCLPVLDVPIEGASDVIGARAYGKDPRPVIELGRAAAEGLMAGGVLPVMKHVPGHGRAFADTHFELPVVDASLSDLQRHDFAPFRELNHLPMAMTAHVVYSAIDPKNPATTSGKVIDEIIRREIGFDGLLMSDDTSMKALSGDFPTKAASILAAGCDLVLHCNGVFEEMAGIASRTKGLEGKSLERAKRAMTYIKKSDTVEETEIRAEFATYFDAVA